MKRFRQYISFPVVALGALLLAAAIFIRFGMDKGIRLLSAMEEAVDEERSNW